jgi:hypothetical protein
MTGEDLQCPMSDLETAKSLVRAAQAASLDDEVIDLLGRALESLRAASGGLGELQAADLAVEPHVDWSELLAE